VVAVEPELHDALVATVSHLPTGRQRPHARRRDARPNHETCSGWPPAGFRPCPALGAGAGIWPDICVENRAAIVEVLDRYVAELQRCGTSSARPSGPLLDFFEAAGPRATACRPLGRRRPPGRVAMRCPTARRPGEVTTLAGRHGVNIVDLEISHSPPALVMVSPLRADAIVAGLSALATDGEEGGR